MPIGITSLNWGVEVKLTAETGAWDGGGVKQWSFMYAKR